MPMVQAKWLYAREALYTPTPVLGGAETFLSSSLSRGIEIFAIAWNRVPKFPAWD